MKNEPEDYSIDDLKRDKTEPWDGIRNYQVRNMIRDDMSIGDLAFFYHSNCDVPGIYGLMTINTDAYPDHTAFDKKAKYYDIKRKTLKVYPYAILASKRLTQLSLERNKRSFQVTSAEEIDESWFKNCDSIGVSAGASTPDETIEEVISKIKKVSYQIPKNKCCVG